MAKYYKDLIAWQKAMDLVEIIYRTTEKFPFRERNGLADQLRRAAVSVPSNIAEGQARYSPKDFARFLRTARASLAEDRDATADRETAWLFVRRKCQWNPEEGG